MKSSLKISPDSFADYIDMLRSSAIFDNCKTDILSEIIGASTIRKYGKGEQLFIYGDKANSFYMLISGWVKLYRETMDGNEAISDIFGSGEIFSHMTIFDDFTHKHNCEIIEDAEILLLPLGLLSQKIDDQPQLALNILRSNALATRLKNKEIEHLSIQNAPQRIGCFLLRLCKAKTADSIMLHLPYDKTMIAAKLGMQPETFSRALKKLKADAGIDVIGGNVEIKSIQALSQYCCGACSSSFPCGS